MKLILIFGTKFLFFWQIHFAIWTNTFAIQTNIFQNYISVCRRWSWYWCVGPNFFSCLPTSLPLRDVQTNKQTYQQRTLKRICKFQKRYANKVTNKQTHQEKNICGEHLNQQTKRCSINQTNKHTNKRTPQGLFKPIKQTNKHTNTRKSQGKF